jgi:hypothetical protein
MKRKTFLNRIALGSGGAMLLPTIPLLQGCEYEPSVRTTLTSTDIPLLDELAETILPATEEVGGAKAAEVGEYILLMYNDCMETDRQALFLEGINEIDTRSAELFSSSFQDADAGQKLQLLETIQSEAIAYNEQLEDTKKLPGSEELTSRKFRNREPKETLKPGPHYFDLLKGMVISGYSTSEIGMTEARNYLSVPGKFEACIPYNKTDKVWAL